jgi:hypothetical protein
MDFSTALVSLRKRLWRAVKPSPPLPAAAVTAVLDPAPAPLWLSAAMLAAEGRSKTLGGGSGATTGLDPDARRDSARIACCWLRLALPRLLPAARLAEIRRASLWLREGRPTLTVPPAAPPPVEAAARSELSRRRRAESDPGRAIGPTEGLLLPLPALLLSAVCSGEEEVLRG